MSVFTMLVTLLVPKLLIYPQKQALLILLARLLLHIYKISFLINLYMNNTYPRGSWNLEQD